MAFLEVKKIYKTFGKTEVLKGIDFTLEKGEVLAIIGSSGSGKTTLCRCINFLERPDKGVFSIDGEEIFNAEHTQYSEKEIREKRLHFGMVFQSFNLFPQYTVLKNVSLAPELMYINKKLPKDEKKAVLKEIDENSRRLLDTVGLSEKVDSYPCELSGGQQQRVAIARALAMKPDILCFDEPTSALDPELTGEVLRVIRELKSSDRTMIVVTHEMNFARSVADKVIFMADGVIEEMGTPDEVFGAPKSEKTRAFLNKSLENPMGEGASLKKA
ncbi:MAG: amino acid ABC transporter ATP-binding protein [Oscillospiraceae bacterium]|nr:amino acid ABC transporter ATP-binding protein [Oscillospiraceae bacterium]